MKWLFDPKIFNYVIMALYLMNAIRWAPIAESPGWTPRDEFAARAISLFPLERKDVESLLGGGTPRHDLVAKFCYDLADAMLAERAKRNT